MIRRWGTTAVNHVMARGNNRQAIFVDDSDRQRFVSGLGEVGSARAWQGFAYCLMSNHVHMVIDAEPDTLADGMRDLLSGYARGFNRRHARSGHLFSERFRSVPIDTDAQLLATIRYVARNPLRAGLVTDAEEWPWSSFAQIVSGQPDSGCVHAAHVLPFFHPVPRRARILFARFVSVAPPDPLALPSMTTLVQALGRDEAIRAGARLGRTHASIAGGLGLTRAAVSNRLRVATAAEPEASIDS